MPRALLVLALLSLVGARAEAKMMEHFDLAGLVLRSDAIAIAERTPGKPSHYRVVKALRGKPPAALDLDDSLYDFPAKADARVYVFLTTHEGAPYIMPSGIRAIVDGKVWRFEQWNNPGGWTAVRQGADPSDQWRGGATAIDVAEFERELAAAIARVDAFTAASADPVKHRAQLLALLPPAGDARAQGGFYVDELGRRVQTLLAKAGDLDGALLAVMHDHSGIEYGRELGTAAQLGAVAADASRPAAIRVAAMRAITSDYTFFNDASTIRALVALYADASPLVRAAAIVTSSQVFDWSSSDPADQKKSGVLRGEVRGALAKTYAKETANLVLHAIADAYERGHLRLPERRDLPAFAATVAIARGYLQVDVVCLRGTKARPVKVSGTHDGAPWTPAGFNITVHCGDGLGGGADVALAPGTYTLAVELSGNQTIPLGGMFVDASGEAQLAP